MCNKVNWIELLELIPITSPLDVNDLAYTPPVETSLFTGWDGYPLLRYFIVEIWRVTLVVSGWSVSLASDAPRYIAAGGPAGI